MDAVLVTTPTESHEHYVRKSLRAGRAVFCEKPVAGDIKLVAACYEEADRVQKPLFCAFNRRFDPGMSAVYGQVKEGKIGKVYHIRTCSRDSCFPSISYLKISNGIYHDSAVHDIDMICWIVGEEPVGVMALGSAFNSEVKEIGDVDTTAISLKFPSGTIGSIDLSRYSRYGYDQRLEVSSLVLSFSRRCTRIPMLQVLGEKGMLRVENIHETPILGADQYGVTLPTYEYSFPERYKQAYIAELDHFVDVVLDPSIPLCVTKEQTLLASRVAEACGRSAKEGRMVGLTPHKN